MQQKISFFLRQASAMTPTAIQLIYRCADGKLKYPSGVSVLPKQWNTDTQTTSVKAVMVRLYNIEKAVNSFREKAESSDEAITVAALRCHLDNALKKSITVNSTTSKRVTLFDRFRAIIKDMREGLILTPNGRIYTAGTTKGITARLGIVETYNPHMKLEFIDINEYNRFVKWCNEKGFSKNYIGAIVKDWGAMCRRCGHTLPQGFKKMTEDAADIYLSEQEIAVMYRLALKAREGVTRDWFVLDCYTGLRVSDLVVLTSDNFSNDRITIANKKTGEKVVIPTHPFVRAIIRKYNGFPPKITDVEINRTIKVVAQKAKLNESFLHVITKGGKRVSTMMERWQMVSNHTARRSFITNLKKSGVSDTTIMKLTGIKAVATLTKYDKMSLEDVAAFAQELTFFKAK